MISRHVLLRTVAGALVLGSLFTWTAAPVSAQIRLGSCMLDMQQAKQVGLAGVEVRVGNAADTLEIADPAVRQRYKQQMQETGLVIPSFMMGLLNSNPLASDPRAPAWLDQSIDAAKDMGVKVILVAFFGKGDLREDGKLKQADVDVAVERLKAAAPHAEKAGVILAIENTLSAEQNLEILRRVGHPSVRVYYDVGNSTNNGYDVPAEIRLLKDRIASIHFKDNPNFLGEGKVAFPEIAKALHDIHYQGWIVLETTSPTKDRVADSRRNAEFVRRLLGLASK